MPPRGNFWDQLFDHIEQYGITMIIVTLITVSIAEKSTMVNMGPDRMLEAKIILDQIYCDRCLQVLQAYKSSFLIGYISHYVMNIRPLKQRLMYDQLEKEEEEENRKDDARELVVPTPSTEQKQVGIVKGMINTELVKSLRKAPPDNKRSKPPEPVPELPEELSSGNSRRSVCLSYPSRNDNSDVEDDENLVVVQNSGRNKKRSLSLQECGNLSDKELIETLGNLHGKLATAQLRARTRKMQADMTVEERDDEARTKARQLESIMNLMMQNQEKFGITSEEEIKEQLNMYNF